jgi:hypothetical protein
MRNGHAKTAAERDTFSSVIIPLVMERGVVSLEEIAVLMPDATPTGIRILAKMAEVRDPSLVFTRTFCPERRTFGEDCLFSKTGYSAMRKQAEAVMPF